MHRQGLSDLPGVDNDQDTVSGTYLGDTDPVEEAEATDWCSLQSPHVGSAVVARKEARELESENQFEEAGRQPQNTHPLHYLVLL